MAQKTTGAPRPPKRCRGIVPTRGRDLHDKRRVPCPHLPASGAAFCSAHMDNEPIILPPSPGRRCIAFNHSPAVDDLWTRCTLRSLPGDRLCRMHRDAIDGVMIGLVDYEKSNELVYDLSAKPETACLHGPNSPKAQREAEISSGKCAAQARA